MSNAAPSKCVCTTCGQIAPTPGGSRDGLAVGGWYEGAGVRRAVWGGVRRYVRYDALGRFWR
eukprot:850542-Prymnesium_polylepis.1